MIRFGPMVITEGMQKYYTAFERDTERMRASLKARTVRMSMTLA